MSLKNVLGQVETDDANFFHGRLPLMAFNTHQSGMRCRWGRPPHHWKTATFLAARRRDRIEAPGRFDGPINGELFLADVEQFLVPTLKRDDIVVLDNLGSH